jgi:nucleosome binding factor SPN SPT16 subunit
VDQAKLILSKDKVPRLSDLSMWPAVSGRKTVGTMEAHVNGLRFTSNKGERVEIAYANIRHAIFQPCEAEHTVLLHFHLRHAIILGKKKLKDVQFFTVRWRRAGAGARLARFDLRRTLCAGPPTHPCPSPAPRPPPLLPRRR